MKTKIYKSKISYSFLVFMVFLFSVITYAHSASSNADFYSILAITIILTLTLLFLGYVFLSTDYSIEKDILKIRCGFLYRKDIEISAITEISKTSSLLSSPAASLTDRIKLKFGKYNTVIISPKSKEDFIKTLQKINPDIKVNIG